jgi:putative transposase
MRAATLENRLEELGVLRSFSRPRVSNDNPYSKSLFRTAKYRADYPRRPFASAEEACLWVASFVDWYIHRHRHSGIKFVTPQRQSRGDLLAPCCRLRTSSSATSAPRVRLHSMLASTRSGLDQPTTAGR